jgi:two-component system response regulator NreC
MTGFDSPGHLRSVLAAGGVGLVSKSAAPGTLLEAIRSVSSGRLFVDAMDHHVEHPSALEGSAVTPLSRREKQVLSLVALGFTSAQIGRRLGISPKTAATYRSRLMEKLDLRERHQLVSYANDLGLLKKAPDPVGSL